MDENESLENAAARELAEETGLANLQLQQLHAFGDPGRDPRGHTITIVFGATLPESATIRAKAGDDARNVRWFSLDNLPELAFDHAKIIRFCLPLLTKTRPNI